MINQFTIIAFVFAFTALIVGVFSIYRTFTVITPPNVYGNFINPGPFVPSLSKITNIPFMQTLKQAGVSYNSSGPSFTVSNGGFYNISASINYTIPSSPAETGIVQLWVSSNGYAEGFSETFAPDTSLSLHNTLIPLNAGSTFALQMISSIPNITLQNSSGTPSFYGAEINVALVSQF